MPLMRVVDAEGRPLWSSGEPFPRVLFTTLSHTHSATCPVCGLLPGLRQRVHGKKA